MAREQHLIVAAGVCAALHVAKLPPAVAALQQALAITLVQAGFLLSIVQVAGMLLGAVMGAWADGLGARRSMLLGLALLAAASAAGAAAPGAAMLMALRAIEGVGFLLVVLPGPGWLRQVAPPPTVMAALGRWSAYMPLATALALGIGPAAVEALGWRGWWIALALVTTAMALALARGTHGLATAPAHPTPRAAAGQNTWQRLAQTLSRRGPWVVAGVFLFYAGQWLAVIGFLPTLLRQAGTPTWQVGLAGAGAAAVNMIGNLAAGRLQQRGLRPQAIVALACTAMALGANGFYAEAWPLPLRLAAVTAFSLFGGLIPATLFTLAVRVAPSPQTTGTTVGWMQQGSAMGQFCGPPAVAWAAAHAGGWAAAGWVTATAAGLALLLMLMLPRGDARESTPGGSIGD